MSAQCCITAVRSQQHYIFQSFAVQRCVDHAWIASLTCTPIARRWWTNSRLCPRHVSALSQNCCAIATALHLSAIRSTAMWRSRTDCVAGMHTRRSAVVETLASVHPRHVSAVLHNCCAIATALHLSVIRNTAMWRSRTDCVADRHTRRSAVVDAVSAPPTSRQRTVADLLCDRHSTTSLGHSQHRDVSITHGLRR
jgi:hypothetical protein